jgi:hypothetical protein
VESVVPSAADVAQEMRPWESARRREIKTPGVTPATFVSAIVA